MYAQAQPAAQVTTDTHSSSQTSTSNLILLHFLADQVESSLKYKSLRKLANDT